MNQNASVTQPIAEIKNVTYTHWNQESPTLHDVSVAIEPGTLNVLVGPSGSGKSTLCGLFNGVIPHLLGGEMEGDVFIRGKNTRDLEVKNLSQQVGRVFQDPETMFAMLYVDDEIAFGPENLCLELESIQATVEELLELTDLCDRRSNLVWNLSGGQVQKLGLASVLAMRPEMIVLDEPTSNLDPGATESVHELLLSLREEGITVLLVTRELDEFLAEADQLIVLDEGKIHAADDPRKVLDQHGKYMIDTLGVWLPETSELGVGLKELEEFTDLKIPITVPETIDLFESHQLLTEEFVGEGSGDSIPGERSPEVLISADDVHFTYPGGVKALQGISFDIHQGEWLMILGRNGAGKSTLANLLVGLKKPTSGQLDLFGKPAGDWDVQTLANQIALVFQNPEHQFLTDSVAEEIGYSLMAQGIEDQEEVQRRTDKWLGKLGLLEVKETHPFALSAGLKRRLGVATMLVGEPQILLVDEPTYGQDKEMTFTLMNLMQEIRGQGVAVVMITHDMRLVQEYGERVLVMSGGKLLHDGHAESLFRRDQVLAEANLRRTILHNLLREMAEHGASVEGKVRRTSDLEKLLKTRITAR
jgi:energy-coupling factor transport system ATP-binding protein